MNDSEFLLDATDLYCPLPILKTKKRLQQLKSGSILRVIASDPGSLRDFGDYFRESPDELIESNEENGKFFFSIRKS